MLKVRDLVEARLYEDEEAVVQDALRYLLRARRFALAPGGPSL